MTEGDTVEEAPEYARDALAAVVEAYQHLGRALPTNRRPPDVGGALWLEMVVSAP